MGPSPRRKIRPGTPREPFQRLAAIPDLGRDVNHIRPGYRKIETASHSIFYRKAQDGMLIVPVLHQRMDFERHL
jgi:toxin ParE1/3/4